MRIKEVALTLLRPRRGKNNVNKEGAEKLDPTPMAPPIGYKPQPSIAELVRAMIVSEKLKAEAAAMGAETFEESEDFDVDDDYDPSSPWENDFDPPLREIRTAVDEERERRRLDALKQAVEAEKGGAGGTPPAEGGKAAGPA